MTKEIEKNKLNMSNEQGFTLVDLVIAVILFVIFGTSLIVMMGDTYEIALEVQKSAYANAYATQIFEAIEEEDYYTLLSTNSFDMISMLINHGRLPTNFQDKLDENDFIVNVTVGGVQGDGVVNDNLRKITLYINYMVQGKEREYRVEKLKVREQDDTNYYINTLKSEETSVFSRTFTETSGKIQGELRKEIIDVNNNEVTVKVTVTNTSESKEKEPAPTDIVFVIDNSPSMEYSTDYEGENTRRKVLLESARNLSKALLDRYNVNGKQIINISVVQFHGRNSRSNVYYTTDGATTLQELTSDEEKIMAALTETSATPSIYGSGYWMVDEYGNKINLGYNPNEPGFPNPISGTGIQEGIREGVDALKVHDVDYLSHNKLMILMTDGVPTEDIYGHFSENDTDLNTDPFKSIAKYTKDELSGLATNNIKLISLMVGINTDDHGNPVIEYSRDTNGNVTQVTSTTGDRIATNYIFGTEANPTYGKFYNILAKDIQETITKNIDEDVQDYVNSLAGAVIIDTFPSAITNHFTFEYIDKDDIQGIITNDIDPNTRSITWNIGKLEADKEVSMMYKLKLNDIRDSELIGRTIEINEKVTLSYYDDDATRHEATIYGGPEIILKAQK